jgi:hypothetical protein
MRNDRGFNASATRAREKPLAIFKLDDPALNFISSNNFLTNPFHCQRAEFQESTHESESVHTCTMQRTPRERVFFDDVPRHGISLINRPLGVFKHPEKFVSICVVRFMPYWSSSRVGAVPQGQPNNSKTKKRSERFGRQQKGITMEVRSLVTIMPWSSSLGCRSGFVSVSPCEVFTKTLCRAIIAYL